MSKFRVNSIHANYAHVRSAIRHNRLMLVTLGLVSLSAFFFLIVFLCKKNFTPELISIILNIACNFLCSALFFGLFEIFLKDFKELRGLEVSEFDCDDFIYQINHLKPTDLSKQHIRILDTASEMLRDEQYIERFVKALEDALSKGLNIQILILHPQAEKQIARRQKQLDRNKEVSKKVDLEEDIYLNLKHLIPLLQESEANRESEATGRGKLQVRLWPDEHDENIAFAINMCYPRVYIAYYEEKESRSSPQLLFREGSPLWSFFEEKFEEYWEKGKILGISEFLDSKIAFIATRPITHKCSFIIRNGYIYVHGSGLIETENSLSPAYCRINGEETIYAVTVCQPPDSDIKRVLVLMRAKYQDTSLYPVLRLEVASIESRKGLKRFLFETVAPKCGRMWANLR